MIKTTFYLRTYYIGKLIDYSDTFNFGIANYEKDLTMNTKQYHNMIYGSWIIRKTI